MEKENEELTWMERAAKRYEERGWKTGNKTGSFVFIPGKSCALNRNKNNSDETH